MKKDRELPAVRSKEERDKLIEQWKYLPSYVVHKKMRGSPIIMNIGAEDAVQTSFLALIRAAELWDEKAGIAFNTYAIASIINRLVGEGVDSGLISVPSYLNKEGSERHRYKKYAIAVKEATFVTSDYFEFLDYRHSRDCTATENREFAVVALSKLSDRKREILYKYFFQGKNFRRIGKELGITRQRVEQILHRSLETLRRELGDYNEFERGCYRSNRADRAREFDREKREQC